MLDLKHLDDPFASEMNIVGLDKDGNPGAVSTAEAKTYVVMDESMSTWEERERHTRQHLRLARSCGASLTTTNAAPGLGGVICSLPIIRRLDAK